MIAWLSNLFHCSERKGGKIGGGSARLKVGIVSIVGVIGFIGVCAVVLGLIPVYLSKI